VERGQSEQVSDETSSKGSTAQRCDWCTSDPLYVAYHDREWGIPEKDERALFERLVLEGMQAGLSWFTILKKRAHMVARFHGFEPERLAETNAVEIEDWLTDAGLIRHRGKIESMVSNARLVTEMDGEFVPLLWSFVDGAPVQNDFGSMKAVPAETAQSRQMAKALKKIGFRFVGPTTCYAFMQSAGMVNDHLTSCPAFERCGTIAASWTL
jgi:DNA-3-methyladenine glycosylase I